MILLILQIGAFFVGLWSLITGMTPMTREYRVPKIRARLAGLILLMIIPTSFALGFGLGMTGFDVDSNVLAVVVGEWVVFGVMAGVASKLSTGSIAAENSSEALAGSDPTAGPVTTAGE